jgi:hydroxypyruvate isomerase
MQIDEAVALIARAGFQFVDNFDWRDGALFGEYQAALRRHDVRAGVLVVNKVPDVNAVGCSLVDPRERGGFLRELRACIVAAESIGCSTLEILSGNVMPGVPVQDQTESAIETLRAAVPLLNEHRMTGVVEMLNSEVDHPGYFLDGTRLAYDILDAVASPRVKLLFDIYHVQIAEGNIIQRIRDGIERIGLVHFADVPGRHEPGTGELNFRNVFRAIWDLRDRFDGHVTAEYHPLRPRLEDLFEVRELANFE